MDKEKDLLKKAKNGNIEAFEKLINAHQKSVFNIAYRIIGNYDDANELAQEVFIKIFKSIKNFKEDSSFSTWVYKIATNTCLDELRKRKNKQVVYIDESIKSEDGDFHREIKSEKYSPSEYLEKKELREFVQQEILSLPEEYRTVIILRDFQGFSYDEISKILNCPEGTVKSRINRARQRLKNIFKDKKELLNYINVK